MYKNIAKSDAWVEDDFSKAARYPSRGPRASTFRFETSLTLLLTGTLAVSRAYQKGLSPPMKQCVWTAARHTFSVCLQLLLPYALAVS